MKDNNLIELVDYIDIDAGEFSDINVSFSEYEKKKIYKELKIKRKFNYKKAAAAVIAVSLTTSLGTSYFFPAFAANVPGLSGVVEFLKEKKIISEDSIKYTKDINQIVADNGITVEMQNVMLVDSRLKFFYTVETDKPMDGKVEINYSDLFINKNKVDIGYGVETDSVKISKDGEKEKYSCATAVDVSRINLSDAIDLKWNIKSIKSNEGNWSIGFKADKNEITKDSKIFYPKASYSLKDEPIDVSYDKVVVSPVETAINLTFTSIDKNIKFDKEKFAEEKLGYKNGVPYKLDKRQTVATGGYLGFECTILDDNGNNLDLKSLNLANVEEDKVNMSFFLSGLKEAPKKLILVPMEISVNSKRTNTDYTLDELNKGTITKELDNGMKILIKSAVKEGSKLKINYSIEGKYLIAAKYYTGFSLINAKDKSYVNDSVSPKDSEENKIWGDKESKAWEIDSSKDFNRDFTYEAEIKEGEDYLLRLSDFTSQYKFLEDKTVEVNLEN